MRHTEHDHLARDRAVQAEALQLARRQHRTTVPILRRMSRITTALLAAEVKGARPKRRERRTRKPAEAGPTLL